MRVLPLAAVLSLCAGTSAFAEKAFDYKGLGDTHWAASEWNGVAPKPPVAPTLIFAKNSRFTASAGCNTHAGTYKVQGEKITFEPKSSTKKACQGELGQADQRIVADMKRISRLALTTDGKALVAYAADGKAIMSLRCTKNC